MCYLPFGFWWNFKFDFLESKEVDVDVSEKDDIDVQNPTRLDKILFSCGFLFAIPNIDLNQDCLLNINPLFLSFSI